MLARDLLFVDGRREAEIAWALAYERPSKIVLLAGRPLDLMRRHRRPFFFDMGGRMAARLGLSLTPALVAQAGTQLRITEIPVESLAPDGFRGTGKAPNRRIEPMLHVNRATLLGRAGRDPDVRTLKNGGKAAVFSLATTEKWTDREGRPGRGHGMAPNRGLRPGGGSGRDDAAQGRSRPGRGPGRDARLPRQGRDRPDHHRDRRRGRAGHGQHPRRTSGGRRNAGSPTTLARQAETPGPGSEPESPEDPRSGPGQAPEPEGLAPGSTPEPEAGAAA